MSRSKRTTVFITRIRGLFASRSIQAKRGRPRDWKEQGRHKVHPSRISRVHREAASAQQGAHQYFSACIRTLQTDSPYGNLLDVSVTEGELHITEIPAAIEARKRPFGKSLVFSDMLHRETGYLIDTYHDRHIIEDDFQLLKDPTIIRFQPIRHWTDTKIRAYASCCVISMTLIRVMQWKTAQAGYKMTPKVLKEDLTTFVTSLWSTAPQKQKGR